jgi:hypothetical protein
MVSNLRRITFMVSRDGDPKGVELCRRSENQEGQRETNEGRR